MNIRKMFVAPAVMAVALAVSMPARANDPMDRPGKPASHKPVDWKKLGKRYADNLRSSCDGVRISAANYIGEYRLETAVEGLTNVLASDPSECARYAAALALVQMGDGDANEALDRAARENTNAAVAQFCRSLIFARGDNFILPVRFAVER